MKKTLLAIALALGCTSLMVAAPSNGTSTTQKKKHTKKGHSAKKSNAGKSSK